MDGQIITIWFIFAVAIIAIAYDIWVCLKFGSVSTISWVTWTTARKYPIIVFAVGILCGHLFWVQQTGMQQPAAIPHLTAAVSTSAELSIEWCGMTRCPAVVHEHLTTTTIESNVERDANFHVDSSIPTAWRPSNADFLGSGWAKGHMGAAENHAHSQTAMDATFTLSNVVPQNGPMNSGLWSQLEHYVREMVAAGSVDVATGPLWQGTKLEVIGEHAIWVPTHLFKAVKQGKTARAWMVPNVDPRAGVTFHDYELPIEKVEIAVGMKLFP